MDDEERSTSKLAEAERRKSLPRLLKKNWNSEFKPAFRDLCLSYGEAGMIIINEEDLVLRRPEFDMMQLVPDPNWVPPANDPNQPAPLVPGNQRVYPNTNLGYSMFMRDEKRYLDVKNNKMKLMNKLFEPIEKNLRDELTQIPGYDEAYRQLDLLQLWRLIEQSCVGRGAVSIFQLVARILGMKQNGGSYTSYAKNFKDSVTDLRRQVVNNNYEDLFNIIMDVVFIMGLNQEQFKDKLKDVYSQREWPHYNEFSNTLQEYVENLNRMENLKAAGDDDKDGDVVANAVDAGGGECYNCGDTDHLRNNCPKKRTKCPYCGKLGHLEKYCFQKENDEKEETEERKKKAVVRGGGASNKDEKRKVAFKKKISSPNNRKAVKGGKKKTRPSNKSVKNSKIIRKAVAHLVSQLAAETEMKNDDDDDQEEEDGEDEDDDYGDDEEEEYEDVDEDDEDEDSRSYLARAVVKAMFNQHRGEDTDSDNDEEEAIVDSACRGAHIVRDEEVLSEATTHTKSHVQGITGHKLRASHVGTIGKLNGRALCIPEADANLISLMLLVKDGGRFEGDRKMLRVFNKNDEIVLKAKNRDGFWKCKMSEIAGRNEEDNKAYGPITTDTREEERVEQVIPKGPTKHFTAEERARAAEARLFCGLCGHPGPEKLCAGLDCGCFGETHITSKDYRNALEIYGPCEACLEAKMRADAEKPSLTPPAEKVGEIIHMDLIELKSTCIGGYTQLLLSLDEKSTNAVGVGAPTKGTKSLEQACHNIIRYYNSHGHTVKRITVDDERSLLSLKPFLNDLGITITSTPAGLHEKKMERYVQTIKARKRAVEAYLDYELPAKLELELYLYTIAKLNLLPNTQTGTMSPYQLVTGQRPTLPKYYFGQTGVFIMRRKDSPERRAEWGIFLGYGDASSRYIRAYIPLRDGIYSKSKFVPNPHYPKEWGFKPRLRAPDPKSKKSASTTPTTTAAASSEEKDLLPEVAAPPRPPQQVNVLVQRSTNAVTALPAPPIPLASSATIHVTPPPSSTNMELPVPTNEAGGQSAVVSSPALPSNQEGANDVTGSNTHQEGASVSTTTGGATPTTSVQQGVSFIGSGETGGNQQQQQSSRPRRAAATTNWRDGPAKLRSYPRAGGVRALKTVAKMQSDPHGPFAVLAYRISLRHALNDRKRAKEVNKAVNAELENMHDNEVLKAVRYSSIPKKYRDGIIPLHMFLKEKYKADGSYDKMKARLVYGGDRVDPETLGDTFSPTVNPISVMTQLNLATAREHLMSCYDIKTAFCITPMRPGERMFVKLPKDLVLKWIVLYPSDVEYMRDDGSMYMEMGKFLYGHPEAPHAFNSLLDRTLQEAGFKPTKADPCCYTLNTKDGLLIVSTHVDDMLLTSPNAARREWFEKQMKKQFDLVVQHDNISYLGMSIHRNKKTGDVKISQEGYTRDLVKKFGCSNLRRAPKMPAAENLTDIDTESPLCDQKRYLSLVMSLMYAARFTRPDILMPVTFLATRSAHPTEEDMSKAMRVLRYLSGTVDVGIHFSRKQKIDPRIYADASHGIHADGRGHGGIVITLGSGVAHARSFKLKMTSRSSSESELIVLEEASSYVEWYMSLLSSFHVDNVKPLKVYQDNKSTIIMASQNGNFKRTKHLIIKENYVKDRLNNGDMVLKYLPTSEMPADMLTKAMSKFKLQSCMAALNIV
jgi:hypothetical protein